MKSFLLFIAWITIHYAGYPQGKVFSIKGIITDSASGEPLEGASVSLLRQANLIVVREMISGENGFEFRRVTAGNYLLSFSFIGYLPDTIRIAAGSTDTVYSFGTIGLVKSSGNLMEVVVRSAIPPVIVKNDTLVYNANTVTMQPNATIEDLIRKLPGMKVDKNGDITLHGQKVEKIYIDGKEFFLNDPKMATQNLTADMVDVIEAFNNQSDRAHFTGIKEVNINKAINLRLKKDKKKEFSGNITVKAGTQNIYSGAAAATWFKDDRLAFGKLSGNHANNLSSVIGLKQSDINRALNFRDNISTKVKLVANYAGGSNRNRSGQSFKRETFLEDSSLLQNSVAFNDNRSVSRALDLHLTYIIDTFSSIVCSPSVSWRQNKTTNADSSLIFSEKSGISYISNEGQTMKRVSANDFNLNNTVAYRRRFRKKGQTLYGLFSQNNYRQTIGGHLYSLVKFYDNSGDMVENKTLDQQYDQKSSVNNYGLDISYTEPINTNQIIDLGYSLNGSSGVSGKRAFSYNPSTGKYDWPDTLTTNNFTNRNTQQNFSIGYNFIGKKVQYQLGISVLYSSLKNENNHTYTTIEQHSVNWSPRASVFYSPARQKNLQIQYSGNSMAPNTEMLQPIPDLSDPFLVKLGNPNLKQQFQHRVNINYNASDNKKLNNLSLQFGSGYTMNKIVQSATILSTGIQELMYMNVNGVYSVNSSMNYGFTLSKIKNGSGEISTSIQYYRDINFVNGQQNARQSFAWRQFINLNYHAKDKLYAGVSAALNYSHSHYSIGTNLNTELFSQNYTTNISCIVPLNIRISSDFTFQINGKQGNLPGRTIATWNASVYRNIFRNNKGEIRLSGFDLLNTNKGFSQTVGDNYIEVRETIVLQRNFILSLRYNFRVNLM